MRDVELVDKPGSVLDNHSSRRTFTHTLKQPTRTLSGQLIEFLFGLATSGVYHAIKCYHSCGVLLPHPFTLT
uniref:Transposase n=1 Tax=Histophilus somni (strain 129Pt) TaxID=205914 RepID=Q0I3E8_HISS1